MASLSPSTRVSTLLLLLTLPACGPKDQEEDTGDDAGTTTTTGEVTTSGDASDPTAPTGASVSGTSGGTASTTGGTSSPSTSATSASTTGADPTATSTTTAPDTGDTTPPDPVDPPVPCEGEATPLVGITTKIGYLKSQIPPRPETTGGTITGTGSGGDELEPGTLFVKLSDQAFTCADPNALLDCGPHWEVTIVIPPEFQTPGIHNLLGQDVRGTAVESSGGEGCSFGGGSFGATFEILAIDDEIVSGRLCNVDDFFGFNDPQLEGSFTATRCPL